jgi:hypothetical protein
MPKTGGFGLLLIQYTSLSNMNERVKKILDSKRARYWVAGGGRVVVLGWFQQNGKWTANEKYIEEKDFDNE